MSRASLLGAILIIAGGTIVTAAEVRIDWDHVLSTKGSTRATAYAASNKVITIGAKTHVAWLDSVSDTMISTLDHETGQWSEPVLVGSGLDNHGGPALCADSKGYLHVAFGPHHGPLQYAVSARPNDASEWVQMPPFGDTATYPALVCGADDTLYCTYRGLKSPWKLVFQKLPAGGEWSAPVALVDAAVQSGYTQFGNPLCLAPDGTLHVAFHVYDLHPAAGKAVGHLQSTDGGDTWTLADGTAISLPYTPQQPGWIVQGSELDMRVGGIDCDPDGRPYLTVSTYKPAPATADLWRFTGDAWQRVELSPVLRNAGAGPACLMGPLCFDEQGRLHVAIEASRDGAWGGAGSETYLLLSADRGDTFEVLPISVPDAGAANWLANIERHTGHNNVVGPVIQYTHGVAGEGCTPEDVTEVHAVRIVVDG